MSYSSISKTFALAQEFIPSSISSIDELESFVSQSLDLIKYNYFDQRNIFHEKDIAGKSLVLCGSSRSNWFLEVIDNLTNHNQLNGLSLLKKDSCIYKFELSKGEHITLSVFDDTQIGILLEAIDSFFEQTRDNPEQLLFHMPGWEVMAHFSQTQKLEHINYWRDEILEAVNNDLISIHPSVEIGDAEDGIGPSYLFVFLRTLKVILINAKANNQVVVHQQILSA